MIIALCGKKYSGKDTACEILKHSYANVKRLAFADALKQEVAKLFGAPDTKTIESNKGSPIVRKALQIAGDVYKEKDPLYFCHTLEGELTNHQGKILVITDLRFQLEANYIRKFGGFIWRIRRSETDNSNDSHPSETELESIKYDFIITNDWTKLRFEKLIQVAFTDTLNLTPRNSYNTTT